MSTRRLGIDLGGSAIKLGVALGSELVSVRRVEHSARGLEAVAAAAAQAWRSLPPDLATIPFGVAVAGLVRDGVVLRSGNLDLTDAPLRQSLEHAIGRTARAFVSDARALGVAAGADDSRESIRIALGLGTGVGGSLVREGAIVRETGLGHGITLDEPALAPCAVGHPACLEAFLGSAALVREARAIGLEVGSPSEIDALSTRDERARGLLERAGHRLAVGMVRVLQEGGLGGQPAVLVLSGGVASSETLRAAASRSLTSARVRVALSRFGSDAPVAGAALAAT